MGLSGHYLSTSDMLPRHDFMAQPSPTAHLNSYDPPNIQGRADYLSDRGRIQDEGVREWLRTRFAAGRSAGRTNVLLTGHHPYEYEKTSLEALNDDVRS